MWWFIFCSKVQGSISLCWYWNTCWSVLFKLSLHKRNLSNHEFKWQTIWLLDWGVLKKSVLIWYTFFLIHHSCVIGFFVADLLSSHNQIFAVLIYCFHSSYPHMQNLSLQSLESSTTLLSIPYLVHYFNQWTIQKKTISISCTKSEETNF